MLKHSFQFKQNSTRVARTKRSSVPYVIICKDVHLSCKKNIDIVYTVKEFSSIFFLCKTKQKDKKVIFEYFLWQTVGSNRTWKTYFHKVFCLSLKFGCSRFCQFWDHFAKKCTHPQSNVYHLQKLYVLVT